MINEIGHHEFFPLLLMNTETKARVHFISSNCLKSFFELKMGIFLKGRIQKKQDCISLKKYFRRDNLLNFIRIDLMKY